MQEEYDDFEDFLTHIWVNRYGEVTSYRDYYYTGVNFNVVSGSRFSASDSLSGFFRLDCGLAGGTGDCQSLPFSDYVSAVTDCSFTASGSPDLTISCADASESGFVLETDASGQLTGSYNITFESSLEGGNGARIVMNNNGGFTVARPGAAGGEGRVDYTVGAWVRGSTLSWGTPELLETDEFSYAEDPHIAGVSNGNVIAIWQQDDELTISPATGDPIYNLWANRYTAGGGWNGPELVETGSNADAFNPEIAVDHSGNAIVVWENNDFDGNVISASRYVPGIGWGDPETVGEISGSDPTLAMFSSRTPIAADGIGNMHMVWHRQLGDPQDGIYTSRFGGGGEPNGKLISDTLFADVAMGDCARAAAAANSWHFAQEVTALDCAERGIRSLGGLDTFVNLETLNVSGNPIDDIAVIARFPALRQLGLANIPALLNTDLLLTRNKLVQVDLSGPGDGTLDCGLLTALTDKGVTVFQPATCRERIADVELADAALKVCAVLVAERQQLTFVDEMQNLDCERNVTFNGLISDLTGVDVFQNLEAINIDRSNVQDLSPLMTVPNLMRVDASSTFISTLAPLASSSTLEVLTLRSIPQLYVEDPTGILILASMPSLSAVYLNEKDYCDGVSQCTTGAGRLDCAALQTVASSVDVYVPPQSCNMPISDLAVPGLMPDANLRQCVLTEAANAGVTHTDDLRNLQCGSQSISQLDGLEFLTHLDTLGLGGNPVQDLQPINAIRYLTVLDLDVTSITDFDALTRMVTLVEVRARNIAQLTDVSELLRMRRLVRVYLHGSGAGLIPCADIERLQDIVDSNAFFPPGPPVTGDGDTCSGGPPTPPLEGRSTDLNNDGSDDLVLEFESIDNAVVTASWVAARSDAGQFLTSGGILPGFSKVNYLRARAVAVGDANDDQHDDLLLQLYPAGDDSIEWRAQLSKPDGSGEFDGVTGSVFMPEGSLHNAHAIAFNDVNNDGNADILIQQQVTANVDGTDTSVVDYYLSMGDGLDFSSPAFLYRFDLREGRPVIIALEDVNNDDMADLVYSIDVGASESNDWLNGHCFGVRTYPFKGDSGSSVCYQQPIGPFTVLDIASVADIDGNDTKELVLSFKNDFETKFGDTALIIATLTFDANRGNETWSDFREGFAVVPDDYPTLGTSQEFRTVEVADINNDGRSDVLVEIVGATSRSWIAYASSVVNGRTSFTSLGPVVSVPGSSLRFKALGLLDFDNDASSLPDILFLRADDSIDSYQLHVAANNGISFNNPTLYYSAASRPRLFGLQEDGLTNLANDTSELLAWVGDEMVFTRQQFKDLLAGKDLRLVVGDELDANEPLERGDCRILYSDDNRDTETAIGYEDESGFGKDGDSSVRGEFGFLACSVPLGDRVDMRIQALYGGCDHTNRGSDGKSLDCEVDVAFIIGVSLEFELDTNVEPATSITRVGKDAFTYAEDGGHFVIFTAGPAVFDAASEFGGALEDAASETGQLVLTQAGQAVFFYEKNGRRAIVIFAYDASKAMEQIIDDVSSAAASAAEGIGGVFVDIGNGLGNGAGRLWDYVF